MRHDFKIIRELLLDICRYINLASEPDYDELLYKVNEVKGAIKLAKKRAEKWEIRRLNELD